MKTVFCSVFLITFCVLSLAQVPVSFNYQVIPRNGSGGIYQNQAMRLRITIFHDGLMDIPPYAEIFSTTTTSFGLINLQIGKGTPESGSLGGLPWLGANCFLKVEIDVTGGTNYVEMGTTQLISVPYALNAKMSLSSVDAVKITGDQTINGNKTFTGTTTVPTPVNQTDATNKAYVDILLEEINHLKQILGIGSITDIDGNSYGTIRIGGQVWMTENLKTTKYRDGTDIPLVDNALDWQGLTTPGYCYYKNDEASYKATYGVLYNWYAASTSTLCPSGWHVPTNAEWTTLTDFLGGEAVAGGKLKETGTTHWNSPNTGATNEVDFVALPGEYRDWAGAFWGNIGNNGLWWSVTTGSMAGYAWYRCIYYNQSLVVSDGSGDKRHGYSVRCIKD